MGYSLGCAYLYNKEWLVKKRAAALVHETLGGMCPFSARRLRRLARDAAASGCDATDYSLSSTARSFVPFYAQRISSAIVMNERRAQHPRRDRAGPQRSAPPTGVSGCGVSAHGAPRYSHAPLPCLGPARVYGTLRAVDLLLSNIQL